MIWFVFVTDMLDVMQYNFWKQCLSGLCVYPCDTNFIQVVGVSTDIVCSMSMAGNNVLAVKYAHHMLVELE